MIYSRVIFLFYPFVPLRAARQWTENGTAPFVKEPSRGAYFVRKCANEIR